MMALGIEDGIAFDIGGIAQHQVETAQIVRPPRLQPVRLYKLRALRQAQPLAIGAGHDKSSSRGVDADPLCIGPLVQESQQQRA